MIPICLNTKPHLLPSKVNFYNPSQSLHYFPIGIYFTTKYNVAPCLLEYNVNISKDVIPFLEKNGELICENTTLPSEGPGASGVYDTNGYWDEVNAEQNKVFFYKDTIIYLQRTHSRKINIKDANFKITIYYKPGSNCLFPELESFFVKDELKNVIYTIMRDEHGSVRFEPFEVSIPSGYNINTCYEDEFSNIHKLVVDNLNKNESGLYLFHGDPGTGKTTYIKYLSSVIKRDIIYVPTGFIEYLADPSFLPALLHKKQSVLVIEDAEKALLARDPSDSSSVVSAVLNITDGIMANVFNIAIIATYNSPRQSIDKALLRKGRLKVEYNFGKLSVKKAQNILNDIKPGFNVTEPMALADIYNIDTVSGFMSKDLFEEKRMGFF